MSKAVSTQSEVADDEGSTATAPGGETSTGPVSTDEAFELLSNQRRRYTLHHLKHNGEAVELGELSEHVASWENGTAVRNVDAAQRKRVYTSLQSHHLPKMDEQGVVEYDERAGVVELTEEAGELDIYLEVVSGRDVPWSQYYLALSAVNAAIVAAVAVGAWPFSILPDIAWAAFVVTTMVVSAAVHIYHDTSMRLGTNAKPPEIRER
ncbi:DUF7344 domain-containing protein [Halorientalis salina]|uniref:DUF7344 domain-containing protein n=1 Tax=Halorientalis salina TaxID=2932266 RepID=UPI0010AB5D86|nr:hypothetical protein [Halorientalis salina]